MLRRLWPLGLTLVMAAPAIGEASASAAVPAVLREAGAAMRFTAEDIARIWAGEVVSRDLRERSKTELALAVAMRIPEGHRDFYARMRHGEFFHVARTVLHAAEIPSGAAGREAFDALRIPAKEVARLGRTGAPGHELNVSQAEWARLQAARAQGGDSAALDVYRDILSERGHAYEIGGVAAVAPYARSGARVSETARVLAEAIRSIAGLEPRCPEFYRAFARFPDARSAAVSHQLQWSVQRILDRDTVILSHRAQQLHADFALAGERQFYVGQGYDALQIVVAVFAVGEHESIVFYTNRTTTDRLGGFAGSATHAIGRRLMLREVLALFREIRGAVGGTR